MRSQRFKKIIQTVTYMPHFISVVVLVGMIIQIFHPMMGLYGYFYGLINNGAHPADLMGRFKRLSPFVCLVRHLAELRLGLHHLHGRAGFGQHGAARGGGD